MFNFGTEGGDDPFGEDDPNQIFGFDLDFNDEIFSDESGSVASLDSGTPTVSGVLSPIEAVPPPKMRTLPAAFQGNLPRRRFGASRARTRVTSPQTPMQMAACPPPMLLGPRIELAAMEKFHARPKKRSNESWTSATESAIRSDQLYNDLCANRSVTLNPQQLGFIPSFFWPPKDIPFVDLVYDFFQRKNNVNCRFLHKLYNALRMSTVSPVYAEIAGVTWVTPAVIKVNKGQFARLLGIKSIDGSLFHQQGNFTTHGFVELNREQAEVYCPHLDLAQVDFADVRLLVHQPGIFTSSVTEAQLMARPVMPQRR